MSDVLTNVEFDADGFMVDANAWSEDPGYRDVVRKPVAPSSPATGRGHWVIAPRG